MHFPSGSQRSARPFASSLFGASVNILKRLALAALFWLVALPAFPGDILERLKYNHPGLVVDLGVGLWAFPLPMDFDGDGDFDLVVSCPDKPYNGVYIFENASGDTAKNKMPVFKPAWRISKGLQFAQVSFVDGQPRVLWQAALPAGSGPPLIADVDGDGASEVVVYTLDGYLNVLGP